MTVGCRDDPFTFSVPGDGLADAAGSELFEGGALGRVSLADVLVQDVNGGPVAPDEGFEPAASFDGVELVVVADDDGPGAGNVDGGKELQDRLVVGHAGFVDQQDGAVVKGELLVLEPPDERGDGAAVDAGFVVEGAGGLAADGGPEDAVAVAFVAGTHDVEGGRLAGAGDSDDEVEATTRSEDESDCVPLAVRQWPAERSFLVRDDEPGSEPPDGQLGLAANETPGDRLDGLLGSEHRRRRSRPTARAGLADERDALAVLHDPGDDTVELLGCASVQRRCDDADDVGAGEGLALRQRPVRSDRLVRDLGAVAVGEGAQWLVAALVDDVEALAGVIVGAAEHGGAVVLDRVDTHHAEPGHERSRAANPGRGCNRVRRSEGYGPGDRSTSRSSS